MKMHEIAKKHCACEFLQVCKKMYDLMYSDYMGFSWHWFEKAVNLLPSSKKKHIATIMGDVQYSNFNKEHLLTLHTKPTTLMTRFIETYDNDRS